MQQWRELQELNEKWSVDMLKQIKKLPNELDRLKLLIEIEKVNLLSEIAQALVFPYDRE